MANKRVTAADYERQAKIDPRRYARNAVRVAVDAGAIKKGDVCAEADETCSGKIEAHHESYEVERWLDVTWLCSSHHRRRHPFHE
jgi:hypothetical protein